DLTICNNSIVYFNSAASQPNYDPGSTFAYSCTTPAPASGAGNISGNPLFVNSSGDFHLQSLSPCIDAGTNFAGMSPADLDGFPRIQGARVDMGAYEFASSGLTVPIAWAQLYGVSTDGTVDSDGDGMNNWQEWRAGTSPVDKNSVLKFMSVARTNNPSGM